MEHENKLRHDINNSREGLYAMAIIGERVLLVEAARQALIEDPAAAERDFSAFILSIARTPEAEWLHDCFISLPGTDIDGNLVVIKWKRAQSPAALPKKEG